MRRIIMSVAMVAAIAFTACKSEKKAENNATAETEQVQSDAGEMAMADVSFGVRGNCGMCKKTIETAALGVDGVDKATWDKDKKKIDVSFDDSKTDLDAIHAAIAASGYDTEKVNASEEAYKELPGCCQYDHAMEMNQSGEKKADDHGHDGEHTMH
ncbi:heavy-metal-associated domain-containing protein [Zhouia amylolytica]|nr:cation transporter [Zhouia amylolytica]